MFYYTHILIILIKSMREICEIVIPQNFHPAKLYAYRENLCLSVLFYLYQIFDVKYHELF